jgi:hypothetical protein
MTDSFAGDLAACAERILGEPAGTFDGLAADRAVAGLGERLGARNLGLVRVADPGSFAWAGDWIAVLDTPEGERRAAVFFGSPSGPLEDADVALAAGATIVDGYLVAPLDLHNAFGADAYGRADHGGTVVGLFTAPEKEAAAEGHDACVAHAGRGLDGDRYAAGLGTFSHPKRRGQDLTLIEAESLEALAAQGVELSGRCAPERGQPGCSPQRTGRTPLRHRGRRLLRRATCRAVRTPPAPDDAGRAPRSRPPRRHPRRRARGRGGPRGRHDPSTPRSRALTSLAGSTAGT